MEKLASRHECERLVKAAPRHSRSATERPRRLRAPRLLRKRSDLRPATTLVSATSSSSKWAHTESHRWMRWSFRSRVFQVTESSTASSARPVPSPRCHCPRREGGGSSRDCRKNRDHSRRSESGARFRSLVSRAHVGTGEGSRIRGRSSGDDHGVRPAGPFAAESSTASRSATRHSAMCEWPSVASSTRGKMP